MYDRKPDSDEETLAPYEHEMDGSMVPAIEQFLDTAEYNYDTESVYQDAKSIVEKHGIAYDDLDRVLTTFADHDRYGAMGLIVSAAIEQDDREEIVFDPDAETMPLDDVGYRLPEDTTLRLQCTVRSAGTQAEGTVINEHDMMEDHRDYERIFVPSVGANAEGEVYNAGTCAELGSGSDAVIVQDGYAIRTGEGHDGFAINRGQTLSLGRDATGLTINQGRVTDVLGKNQRGTVINVGNASSIEMDGLVVDPVEEHVIVEDERYLGTFQGYTSIPEEHEVPDELETWLVGFLDAIEETDDPVAMKEDLDPDPQFAVYREIHSRLGGDT